MNRVTAKTDFGKTDRIPDRFVVTKTSKTDAQIYREARLFGCIRKAGDYLGPPDRFKEQVDGFQEKGMQRAWLSYNGVSRIRWLAELAERGELWLEDDGGERLNLTEWNFHLLYERGRYNTLCLMLEGRTLRFKRDVRIAGLFWEVA